MQNGIWNHHEVALRLTCYSEFRLQSLGTEHIHLYETILRFDIDSFANACNILVHISRFGFLVCRELAVVKIQRWNLDKVALMVVYLRLDVKITFQRVADSLGAIQVLHRVTLREEPLIRLDHLLRLFAIPEVWACQVEIRA